MIILWVGALEMPIKSEISWHGLQTVWQERTKTNTTKYEAFLYWAKYILSLFFLCLNTEVTQKAFLRISIAPGFSLLHNGSLYQGISFLALPLCPSPTLLSWSLMFSSPFHPPLPHAPNLLTRSCLFPLSRGIYMCLSEGPPCFLAALGLRTVGRLFFALWLISTYEAKAGTVGFSLASLKLC